MEPTQVQPAPCPKCEGVRFLTEGSNFGLQSTLPCSALYCTSCGYVEFYANRNTLESLAQARASATARAEQQETTKHEGIHRG